jgi:hypothetical protein
MRLTLDGFLFDFFFDELLARPLAGIFPHEVGDQIQLATHPALSVALVGLFTTSTINCVCNKL